MQHLPLEQQLCKSLSSPARWASLGRRAGRRSHPFVPEHPPCLASPCLPPCRGSDCRTSCARAQRLYAQLSGGCSAMFIPAQPSAFTFGEVTCLPPAPSQAASSSRAGAGSRALNHSPPSAPAPLSWGRAGAREASASLDAGPQGRWVLGREQGWTAKTAASPVHPCQHLHLCWHPVSP